jgi:hypothetical protein
LDQSFTNPSLVICYSAKVPLNSCLLYVAPGSKLIDPLGNAKQ